MATNTPFVAAMEKQLKATQVAEIIVMALGVFLVVVGRLGQEMYNRILTMKGNEDEQLINGNYAKQANTVFEVTTEAGHFFLVLLVATFTYNVGAKKYKVGHVNTKGQMAISGIQFASAFSALFLLFLQSIYGVTLYKKVLNWRIPGDKPEASDKQKNYASRVNGLMIFTMIFTLSIFAFYAYCEIRPMYMEHQATLTEKAQTSKEQELVATNFLNQAVSQDNAVKSARNQGGASALNFAGGWRAGLASTPSQVSRMPSMSTVPSVSALSGGMSTFFNY
jgi:hypothetical protein